MATMFKVDEGVGRPQSLSQILSCDELAGTVQQCLENLKRLIGKIDPDATLPQFARVQIQLEGAEADEIALGQAGGMVPLRLSRVASP